MTIYNHIIAESQNLHEAGKSECVRERRASDEGEGPA